MARPSPPRQVLPLLALLASLAATSSSQAAGAVCPLTGLPPSPSKSAFLRCPEARTTTCCQDCADVANGLALVSSNASNILGSVSPLLLPTLKGQDITFCTVVYPSAPCQTHLEALACALTCNPDSGKYVTATAQARSISLCANYTEELKADCRNAQATGTTPTTNQTFLGNIINEKYFVQSLLNIVTGQLGIDRFDVVQNDVCYNGPAAPPEKKLCCDTLQLSPECPSSLKNFTAHPNWAAFSVDYVDNNTCRAAPVFPVAPLAPPPPASPPPPPLTNGTLSNTTFPNATSPNATFPLPNGTFTGNITQNIVTASPPPAPSTPSSSGAACLSPLQALVLMVPAFLVALL